MSDDDMIENDAEQKLAQRIEAWYTAPVAVDPTHRDRMIVGLLASGTRPRRPIRRVVLFAIAALFLGVLSIREWRRATGRVASEAAVSVRFVLRGAPTAARVALVGDFNGWNVAATPLGRAADGGAWSVDVRMRPGRYGYAFVVDGREWIADPTAPLAPDDFGRPTSVIVVEKGAT